MSSSAESALTGIHPRSETTIRVSRDFDRGRTTQDSLREAFRRDAYDLVCLQKEEGIDWVSDGQLTWQDFLRPICETFEGLKIGADLFRWFDTNTFYRRPTVVGKVTVRENDGSNSFYERHTVWGSLGDVAAGKRKKLALPGPLTIAALLEDKYYPSKKDLVKDITQALAIMIDFLANKGISCIQLNEPSLVYKYGPSEFGGEAYQDIFSNSISDHLARSRAELWLHTYFGDCSKVLSQLLKLEPFELVGIDFTQTPLSDIEGCDFSGKSLGCGCVDGRNSLIESPDWIADFSKQASKVLRPQQIVIFPSTDLKYLPREYADHKLRAVAQAAKLLR
jgi:5-methyltetrahydropteroyltriglutamate--homocysteine methyltransferase